MVIEQLTFRVPPRIRDRFLALDAAIWTATLAEQPGYLGKEAWVPTDDPNTLHLVIRWQSRAAWKAVPRQVLMATEARMADALGEPCPVLSCSDLDVIG